MTCPLRGMTWRDGQVVDNSVTLDEIADVAQDPPSFSGST